MKFLELVKSRKSIRSYATQKVETEKLDYILECARLAPSAVNFQPWQFLIVENEEDRKKLHQCYNRDWFNSAPLYIVACANTELSWKRKSDGKDHYDIDIAIAVEHICLAATESGLGSCWVCNFNVELCKELFSIPSHIIPVVLLPIGYAIEEKIQSPLRKPIEEIIKRK